jgi:MYXO-CTERM domain-containing protein
VMIHERFSRVFAITADLSLDMSVFNDPATHTLRIAVVDGPNLDVCADCEGNYSELIPDINFAEVLEELVGTLLDSALGDGLEFNYDVSTALADALGVPLYVNFLGLETIPATEREFLNVYLQLTNTQPNPLRVRTLDARLAVDAGVLRERHDGLRTHVEPSGLARIELETDGEETEYFAKVDFGMWRGPLTPDADGTLTVRDPKLRMVGAHEITLRGRHVGAPNSLEEEGNVVTVWVDPVAPVVRLVQTGVEVVASATDVGSTVEDLRYLWQLDDGAWSEPSHTAIRPLSELPGRRVSVRAIDPAGNLSKPAALDLNVARMRVDEELRTQGGCGQTAADSAWVAGLLGAALFALRRRRR